MTTLEITLGGHLLVSGNQALDLGVDLATTRRLHEGREVPYIPATAIRGAVRIQLEALLAGIGQAEAGPYVLDDRPGTVAEDHSGMVAHLFGFSGRTGERTGSKEGCLRFGDGIPADPDRALLALSVRPGLEMEDLTATAADQKLFFRQVIETLEEPLVFHADLCLGGAGEEEVQRLRAAVETTDSLGSGRARGGGLIQIRWTEAEKSETSPGTKDSRDLPSATRARVDFTLVEPAHFGDGGPRGNHHATRTYIPGSTVRGALAWALLRDGVLSEEAGFQQLFVLPEQASFGDALCRLPAGRESGVAPVTRRKQRGGDRISDILVTELARDRVNQAAARSGRYLRLDDSPLRFDPMDVRPAGNLIRRTRTRVSIDRHTGAAAESRLFSIEQIDPWLPGESAGPVRFSARVEGLTPEAGRLLLRAAELPALIGAGRRHGLGKARIEVYMEEEPDDREAVRNILALADLVEAETDRLAGRARVAGLAGGIATVPLALVALSDFVPAEAGRSHPLAELDPAPEPVRSFLSAGAVGGYDQLRQEGSLKDLVPAVGAGSVFVYSIHREGLEEWLRQRLPRLRRGVGLCTESGCGRFGLFEPMAKE
ncbi:MAG: RAMP superfamily CRISPR-associated protein [Acidobacteriota bacterium]